LKPERWGSLLVQEKYQEEKACDKRHPYRIIIIIIMNYIPGEHEIKELKKQPYWTLITYYRKCQYGSTKQYFSAKLHYM
jgi:hypothetical protein